jgi:spore maturation protein CgeB
MGHLTMASPLHIAFFGSSLVSAYWNGAATYYRGIVRALHERGHRITFYEPDALDRQAHRDIEDPTWARVVVYPANSPSDVMQALHSARYADIIVKASGVGVYDDLLEREVLALRGRGNRVIFWDVDAPATLERLSTNREDPFRALVPQYDLILTYGGGQPVIDAYSRIGAARCVPIYNALDPREHHPAPADSRFEGLLGFLGNRLPDREERVREFFFKPARSLPQETFLLAGSGWDANAGAPPNARLLGHLSTRDHNAFNCTPRAVININRNSMAQVGFSPPTRVFEAAGAGACLLLDAWDGIECFLKPEEEVLVVRDGDEVTRRLAHLTDAQARRIGAAARDRVLSEHTYAHRAVEFEAAVDKFNLEGVAA